MCITLIMPCTNALRKVRCINHRFSCFILALTDRQKICWYVGVDSFVNTRCLLRLSRFHRRELLYICGSDVNVTRQIESMPSWSSDSHPCCLVEQQIEEYGKHLLLVYWPFHGQEILSGLLCCLCELKS